MRKFDINSLYIIYICQPYLYTVTTLPWAIQKSHFSKVLFIPTSDYYIISEETNCNCCTAAYLFTYRCLLLPIICVAQFYGEFFLSLWSVIFKDTNAKPQTAIFRVTHIWRNARLPAVKCQCFTFYKVVWWYFSGVVGKGVTVCFFLDNINNLKCVWIILFKMTFLDFPR